MIWLMLVLLGLALGSFVNALVWRLHELEHSKKLSLKRKRELSVVSGKSMCTHCGHKLTWHDLIPVLSWLWLRGKCRYCGRSISWQYPLVELGTAVLFVLSYLVWPYDFDASGIILFALWLAFSTGFVALTAYDLKWMELPNKTVYPMIGLALIQTLFLITTGDPVGEFFSAVWGFLVVGGLFYALFQVSAGKWIGGGDVKLGFLIGILVGGPLPGLAVIFLSSLLGTIISLPLLVSKSLKATSRIPFGPFLMAATVVVYLYGDKLAEWYKDLLLL